MSSTTQKAPFAKRRRTWKDRICSDPNIKSSASLVATLLSDRFVNSKSGQCWPKNKTIATRLQLSERTVQRSLSALEQAGYLRLVKKPGAWRAYQIEMPGGWDDTEDQEADRMSPKKVTKEARARDTPVTPYIKNLEKNLKTRTSAPGPALGFVEVRQDETVSLSEWTDWLAENVSFDGTRLLAMLKRGQTYRFPTRFPNTANLARDRLFFDAVVTSSGKCLP